jgi:hypothetical protein
MRHFFRLNVSPEGYVLFAGRGGQTFRPQPLGVESREVPRGYLLAQGRIDDVLKTRQVNWSLSVQWPDSRRRPVVAYGCHVAAPDDRGRQGLTFIHGIELETAEQICPCVIGVLIRIAAACGRQLLQGIGDLALGTGGITTQEFLSDLASSLEKHIPTESPLPRSGSDALGEIAVIAHDCVGGQATAWLILAGQQQDREPPWSLYDSVNKDGSVVTHADPAHGPVVPASQLLRRTQFGSLPETESPSETDTSKRWPRSVVVAAGICLGLGLALGFVGGRWTRQTPNPNPAIPSLKGIAIDLAGLTSNDKADHQQRLTAAALLLQLSPHHEGARSYLSALSGDAAAPEDLRRTAADLLTRDKPVLELPPVPQVERQPQLPKGRYKLLAPPEEGATKGAAVDRPRD